MASNSYVHRYLCKNIHSKVGQDHMAFLSAYPDIIEKIIMYVSP